MELEDKESAQEQKREQELPKLPKNRFGHIPRGTRVQDYRPEAPKNSTQFVIGEWTKFRSESMDGGSGGSAEEFSDLDENGTFAGVRTEGGFLFLVRSLVRWCCYHSFAWWRRRCYD